MVPDFIVSVGLKSGEYVIVFFAKMVFSSALAIVADLRFW
jgi:hypothetical protein